MGYTLAQVEEIASKLRALPEIEPPPKDLTKQEVVKMLAKEIKALQKRGYSLDQIASSLKGEGLDISTPTLKSYLQRTKAKAAKPKSSTPRTPKTPSVASRSTSATESTESKPAENVSPSAAKVEISGANQKTNSQSKSGVRPDSEDL